MATNRKRESFQLEAGSETLSQIHTRSPLERIVGIENSGEKAEMKASGVPNGWNPPLLSGAAPWPWGKGGPFNLGSCYTSGTLASLAVSLATVWPTAQVATHADHSLESRLHSYITFEGRAPLGVRPFGGPSSSSTAAMAGSASPPRTP